MVVISNTNSFTFFFCLLYIFIIFQSVSTGARQFDLETELCLELRQFFYFFFNIPRAFAL